VTLFESAASGGPAQVKMVVAYDGTDFSGFAAQPNQPHVRTVGGVLSQAISKVLRHDVELACSGRTDAGVHAWGQVVSFQSQPGLDPWKLASAVTSILGPFWVRRASLGEVATLPVHDRQPAGA
jgi:tRNA pseudouridine38-40 synthase